MLGLIPEGEVLYVKNGGVWWGIVGILGPALATILRNVITCRLLALMSCYYHSLTVMPNADINKLRKYWKSHSSSKASREQRIEDNRKTWVTLLSVVTFQLLLDVRYSRGVSNKPLK